jgi:C4-dicarboxylate transporter DctM subunit
MSVTGTLLALALIGAPLFVIVGVATGVSFWAYTTNIHSFSDFGWLIDPLEELLGKDPFLAIPLFIASGAIMTAGGLAERLVNVARAAFGWLPGGMAVAAVTACMFFAAISGSSPVTLIAVGSIMFPAMTRSKYPENFSLGIIMTAGSLGCLVPPALAILIYAIAVTGNGSVDPSDLFMAALMPAFLIAGVLAFYAVMVGRKIPGSRDKFSWSGLGRAIGDGVWALLLPVIVLGGIYGGFYAPFKAGAVAVVYSLVVTMFIYRELNLIKAVEALAEAGKLMGMLILIIGLAFGLNKFLGDIKIDQKFVTLIERWDLGPVGFMFLVNVVLVVLGALMDSISATLIFAPILAPIAFNQFGMDPLHFGVVFVVNMEIGYLAPPVATNLFVASALFKKPFGQVCMAVLPTLGITLAALTLFMYVPTCSVGLVNVQQGRKVYQSFPWDGKPAAQTVARAPTTNLQEMADESMKKADKEADSLNKQSDDDYYGPAGGGDQVKGGDAGAEDDEDEAVDEMGKLDLPGLKKKKPDEKKKNKKSGAESGDGDGAEP